MSALPLWNICRERRTAAGIATEQLGLRIHAATAARAVEQAKSLGIGIGLKLVAIQEAS